MLDLQIFSLTLRIICFLFFYFIETGVVMKLEIAPECWNYSHWVITLVRNIKLIKSNIFIGFSFVSHALDISVSEYVNKLGLLQYG